MKKIAIYLLLLLGISALYFIPTHANSGPIEIEEFGSFELVPIEDDDISIASEHLVFDFTKSSNFSSLDIMEVNTIGEVRATYQMHNQAATKQVRMGFPLISQYNSNLMDYTFVTANDVDITPEIFYGRTTQFSEVESLSFEDILDYVYPNNFRFEDTQVGYLYEFTDSTNLLEARFITNSEIQKVVWSGFNSLTYDENFGSVILKQTYVPTNARLFVMGEDIALTTIGGNYTKTQISYNDYIDYIIENNDEFDSDAFSLLANEFDDSIVQNDGGLFHEYYWKNNLSGPRFILLVYTIELNGDNVDNEVSVTYPILPSINYRYTPSLFTYNYLTSPASHWASFSNLTIQVYVNDANPFITASSIEFEKTGTNEFMYVSETLPEENISFTTCASENPRLRTNGYVIFFVLLFIVFPIVAIIVFIGLVSIVLLIVTRYNDKMRRKQNEEIQQVDRL